MNNVVDAFKDKFAREKMINEEGIEGRLNQVTILKTATTGGPLVASGSPAGGHNTHLSGPLVATLVGFWWQMGGRWCSRR
jgi:hypothetical protein